MTDRIDVSEHFCRQTPDVTIEWPDGSSAASYPSGHVVIWDSHSNPTVIAEDIETRRDTLIETLTNTPAEDWPWETWNELCNYPDQPIDDDTWKHLTR